MASGLDQAVIGGVLDGTNLAGSGYVTPSAGINPRQMTAEGSSTAAGIELGTSGGYTEGGNAVTFDTSAAYASGHRQSQNSSAVSISNMPPRRSRASRRGTRAARPSVLVGAT